LADADNLQYAGAAGGGAESGGTMPVWCLPPRAGSTEAFNAVVLYMTPPPAPLRVRGYPGAGIAGTRAGIGKDGKPGEAVACHYHYASASTTATGAIV